MSDVELQSQFKAFFLNCTRMDEMSTTSMKKMEKKKEKKTVIRQRPGPSESKTNTGPSAHTSRGLLTCTRLISDAHSLHDLLIQ